MHLFKKTVAGFCALGITAACAAQTSLSDGVNKAYAATKDISSTYDWDTLKMGGAGFVSGIVAGKSEMYLRTDVGGAYRYDYDKSR